MPQRKRAGRAHTTPKPAADVPAKISRLLYEAHEAGKRCGCEYLGEEHEEHSFQPDLNRYVWRWWRSGAQRENSRRKIQRLMESFIKGFCRQTDKQPFPWLLLPTDRTVAAIVTVKNEERRIGLVLDELRRLPLSEIIVVVNGSDDDSYKKVRRHPADPILIHYDAALGYDVGRALGARASASEFLLFMDGDIPIKAERLIPFIEALEKGTDVALNDIGPFLGNFKQRDSVSIVKEFMNRSLGRADLMANSLTAVPHSLTREAAEKIGLRRLAVPPLAQAEAILKGLNITAPASINVISRNLRRTSNRGRRNPVANLIIGDHLEAFHHALTEQGNRLRFPDKIRERDKAGG